MEGKPLVILLVEDDLAHAEIVKRNLEDLRIANQLVHVSDGEEALDCLFGRGAWSGPKVVRPHVILLDLRLPKIDGLEVLRTIKADESLASIPVVILTTSDTRDDVTRAYSSHVNSYLVKPLELDKFVNLIRSLGDYWLSWNIRPAGKTAR